MKQRSIDLQLIKPVQPGSSGAKGKITLKQLFKEQLDELNIAVSDCVCPSVISTLRYNDGEIEFYNESTKTWEVLIVTGGELSGFTPGAVLFGDVDTTIGENPTQLFYDNINNRLGIGTSSPQATLHVVGTKAIIDTIDIYSSGAYTGVIPYTDGIGNNFVTADQSNTSIGYRASLNTTGVFNVALGIRSQENPNIAGAQAHNTSVGAYSLRNTRQYGNTAIGSCAMHSSALFYTTTAIGAFSLAKVTTTPGTNGINTRGITAVGYLAMGTCLSVGEWTTAVGYEAGTAFNGGSTNTAIGAFSMGAGSAVLGGTANLTGTQNTGLGVSSLFSLTTGTANIGIGVSAGRTLTTGTGNIFLGYSSGYNVVTGNYNVIIGGHLGASLSGLNNHVLLADGQGNQRLLINNFGAYEIGGSNGTAGQVLTSNGNAAAPTWQSVSQPTYDEGVYTPTLFNVANISASSASTFNYIRVGDRVHVFGEVDIDPTTTLTLTQLGISLPPISSAVNNTFDIAGTSADDLGTSARITGDVPNGRAELRMTPTDVTNRTFSVHFSFLFTAA